MHKRFILPSLCAVFAVGIALLWFAPARSHLAVHRLPDVPSAISVTLPAKNSSAQMRMRIGGKWSDWQVLTPDEEHDPELRESSLVMLGTDVEAVEVQATPDVTLHPIHVSSAPPAYDIAATVATKKRILSRSDWGADESLRIASAPAPGAPATASDSGAAPSQRVQDCLDAQRSYPDEFKTVHPVGSDEKGRRLRWPMEYSPAVRMLVVHHTAIAVGGDARSGVERVRALYAYHANNRGWGDIGYHFLVDEDGRIYEGRAGGPAVVGGHAYCNNVGTVGVALLGNFEEEKPTQVQLASLQWLLSHLAEEYGINLQRPAAMHGKSLPAIVGHGDLVSTECPGYYVRGSLSQIRTNVASGNTAAVVRLPAARITVAQRVQEQREQRIAARVAERTAATQPVSRGVQRLLNSDASQLLLRKLRRNGTQTVVPTPSAPKPSVSRTAVRRTSSSSSATSTAGMLLRIRLTRQETGAARCDAYDLAAIGELYRGTVRCTEIDGTAAIINTVTVEEYLLGLGEEPDSEPFQKQRAFAVAARTYAAHYALPSNRKFPGKPYDGDDSPARFQLYVGKAFEQRNPSWLRAVRTTDDLVLMVGNAIIRPPYFSASDGRTRSPAEAGWATFPFAEVFASKADPWCVGQAQRGHGVGMSGCGAKGQALEGRTGEQILEYYYPGTRLQRISSL